MRGRLERKNVELCDNRSEAGGRRCAAPQPQASQLPQAASQGLQVTERAVKRIRVAMAKEGVSPTEGGLRLGVMGGGCSGLSYSIKFDTQPARA